LPATKARRRRHVEDYRKLDAVEIRPAVLPVIRVARHCDPFVRLELDEFERAGADRMLSHLGRRDMARIDYRTAGSEQSDKRRLWPMQVEGDLEVAVGGHFLKVVVPRLARIETKPLARLTGEQIPGAFDIRGGEGLAVVPFDSLAQWEGQFGSVLAP